MKRSHRWAVVGMLTLLFGVTTSTVGGPAKPGLQGDQRLSHSVTVETERVYLGELLEKLTRQAQVPLIAETTKGPIDGIELCVMVRDQPLREVMDSIVELLSHRFHHCEWREGGSGHGYILRHYPTLEAASVEAQAAIRSRWSADVHDYYDIARLPDDERLKRAAERPDLFPGGAGVHPESRLIRLVEPDQLGAALTGARIPLDLDHLPAEARDALSFGIKKEADGSSGLIPRNPAPPGFFVTWERGHIGPILWVRNGENTATNLVGGPGWDGQWLRTSGEGWRSSGDEEVQRFLIRLARGEEKPGPVLEARTLPEWIRAAHRAQGTNYLLDPVQPLAASIVSGARVGASAEESLFYLLAAGSLTAKQHGQITLLRHQTACVNPRRHLLAWSQIQRLRQAAERNRGYLGLRELVELSEMNDAQLEALSDEFPVANSGEIGVWRPILQFCANLPARDLKTLGEADGLLLADSGLVARRMLLPAEGGSPSGTPLEKRNSGPQSLARLREVLTADPTHSRISVRLERTLRRQQVGFLLACEAWAPGQARQRMEYPLPERKPLNLPPVK